MFGFRERLYGLPREDYTALLDTRGQLVDCCGQAIVLGEWIRVTITPDSSTLNLATRAQLCGGDGRPVAAVVVSSSQPIADYVALMGVAVSEGKSDFTEVRTMQSCREMHRVGELVVGRSWRTKGARTTRSRPVGQRFKREEFVDAPGIRSPGRASSNAGCGHCLLDDRHAHPTRDRSGVHC